MKFLASHIHPLSPVLGSDLDLVKSLVTIHPCPLLPTLAIASASPLCPPVIYFMHCVLTLQNQRASLSAPQFPFYLLETIT